MKVLKYNLCTLMTVTHVDPVSEMEFEQVEEVLTPVEIRCTTDNLSANEEIAKKEAYKGEYTIEDDGQPEPEAQPSDAERIAELEEALDMLLNGVTE